MSALNFNAHARLVEIHNRTALAATPATPATDWTEKPITVAGVATVAATPWKNEKTHHADNPADWPAALARTDATRPPPGHDPDWWQFLVTDARWLCRDHGPAAAALGWSASDLFGIGAAPGWGGLADRLEGTRNLVMTDRIAHWRRADLEGRLWRESMRTMPLLWTIGG